MCVSSIYAARVDDNYLVRSTPSGQGVLSGSRHSVGKTMHTSACSNSFLEVQYRDFALFDASTWKTRIHKTTLWACLSASHLVLDSDSLRVSRDLRVSFNQCVLPLILDVPTTRSNCDFGRKSV